MKKFLLPVLVSSLLVSSCEFIGDKRERGNGHVITGDRTEKNFRGVESHGNFEVSATTGNDYAVKIETDENLQQYIRTAVVDGYLKITTEDGINIDPTGPLKVYVTAPVFEKLSSSGSGDIKGENEIVSEGRMEIAISGSGDINAKVRATEINASISGSGNINLSGSAQKLKTSIAGNGDINAGQLSVDEATIEIMGSGNTMINASKKLNIHIAGSGDVKYSGNPEIHQEIMGSGNIEQVE